MLDTNGGGKTTIPRFKRSVCNLNFVTAPCNVDDEACVAIEQSNAKWKQTRFVCSDCFHFTSLQCEVQRVGCGGRSFAHCKSQNLPTLYRPVWALPTCETSEDAQIENFICSSSGRNCLPNRPARQPFPGSKEVSAICILSLLHATLTFLMALSFAKSVRKPWRF